MNPNQAPPPASTHQATPQAKPPPHPHSQIRLDSYRVIGSSDSELGFPYELIKRSTLCGIPPNAPPTHERL